MDRYRGAGIGVVVHCEHGHVTMPSYNEARAYDADGKEIERWSGSKNHFANFIDAVRSRRPGDLNSDILEGHLSSALCHTGNISYLRGVQRGPEAIRDALASTGPAAETFDRLRAHLEANEIDLDLDQAVLGAWLEMDPETERFHGDEGANRLLTRPYRAPFTVPVQV